MRAGDTSCDAAAPARDHRETDEHDGRNDATERRRRKAPDPLSDRARYRSLRGPGETGDERHRDRDAGGRHVRTFQGRGFRPRRLATGPALEGRISVEPGPCQTPAVPKTRETGLRAVLFTDVVGSTELAREMGDVRWSRLLAAQRRVIRALLKSNGGREVDTAGDGFFAVFDRPADAVRCAFAACSDVQELGLDIRGGVHFGEVELAKNEVHGIVVHTGARVMGHAGACEVLVTATVRDLVAGSTFDLQERGNVELKGVPGTWTLYDVMAVDEQLRPSPIEGASVASERRDRVAAAPAPAGRGRRWILPGRGRRDRARRRSPPTSSPARTRRTCRPPARSPRSRQTARSASPSRSHRCRRRSLGGRAGSGSPTSRARSTGWTPRRGETGSRGAAGAATGCRGRRPGRLGHERLRRRRRSRRRCQPDRPGRREPRRPRSRRPIGLRGDRVGRRAGVGDRYRNGRAPVLRPRHTRRWSRSRSRPSRRPNPPARRTWW